MNYDLKVFFYITIYIPTDNMPKKYAKRITRQPTKPRRQYRKRARRPRFRRPYMSDALSGMPKTRRAILRYTEHVTSITSTLGALGSYVFRANGCYDPNYSSTGHQPMGWDQWSALYNHYVVLGAKMTLKVLPSASSTSPCIIGTIVTDGTAVPYSTPGSFIEAKRGPYRLFKATDRVVSLVQKYSSKRQFNVVDVKDNVARIGSPVTADPAEEAMFNIWFFTMDNTTASPNVFISIDYIVEFSEPKDMTTS